MIAAINVTTEVSSLAHLYRGATNRRQIERHASEHKTVGALRATAVFGRL
jgi:hypothetical protein